LSGEVRVWVEYFVAAVEPGHRHVADGALKNQLATVGSNGAEELVHGAPQGSVRGRAVANLVVVGPDQDIKGCIVSVCLFLCMSTHPSIYLYA
jgi:hypothetical protein